MKGALIEELRSAGRVALIGDFVPRRCGIATFTHDLAEALRSAGLQVDVVAMSDQPGYEYPQDVVFEIDQDDPSAYVAAARYLNQSGYGIVCVQHEYGIFGGQAGRHLLLLLRELNMPIVTTLHTVLTHPTPDQKAVMDELIQLSQRVVVMTERARGILRDVHGVDGEDVTVIPHGIPDLPDDDPETIKASYGLAGRPVVATFGLLSPDKGIEYVIEAMATVPDAVYVIAGQTHPHIRRQSGESYRESLAVRAKALGVADRVVFWDRYMDDTELGRLLKMADVYVTPYLKPQQITSGTLAFSVGNGKAVISTPYWHAEELLADGRGVLVPFRDAHALAGAINDLLGDPLRRRAIESKAYDHGRSMRWPAVGLEYRRCFEQTTGESVRYLGDLAREVSQDRGRLVLPPINLSHLARMTDDVGILQHARHNLPRRSDGYCVDDNARALILTVMLQEKGYDDPLVRDMQARYLAFCEHAFDPAYGRFRNFMGYDRTWLEAYGSEDSHGRSMWALGFVAGRCADPGARAVASEVFDDAWPAVRAFTSPRAWAYTALGWVARGLPDDARELAAKLVDLYRANRSDDWPWFEPILAYANSRLPQTLLEVGSAVGDDAMVEVGLETLAWLSHVQQDAGRFSPVGSNGFYPRSGRMAKFDQQPIEAAAHISACLVAHRLTGESQWRREAERAYGWFLGRNTVGLPVAVVETGACCDGLETAGVNQNQGAESTLSYLMATLEMASVIAPVSRTNVR